MNRRSALKNVVIFSAGIVLIPSCMQEEKSAFPVKNFSLSSSQEELLKELCSTILPSGKDFPGAKELKSDEFVLMMMDDCTSPEDQQKFSKGMTAFQDGFKKSADKSFVKATQDERGTFLKTMKKTDDDPAWFFYDSTRHFTIQSFTSGSKYMTEIKKYKMVPGPTFKGCVPVETATA